MYTAPRLVRIGTRPQVAAKIRQVQSGSSFWYEPATVYATPTLERLGSFRRMTQAGGCLAMADGANPYHRYDGKGDLTCPLD